MTYMKATVTSFHRGAEKERTQDIRSPDWDSMYGRE
jgi:hypothetical protein